MLKNIYFSWNVARGASPGSCMLRLQTGPRSPTMIPCSENQHKMPRTRSQSSSLAKLEALLPRDSLASVIAQLPSVEAVIDDEDCTYYKSQMRFNLFPSQHARQDQDQEPITT